MGKVIQRVKIGDMPPPESSTLSDKERAQFVSWLEVAINDIDCGRTPIPGRVTLRRLNRHEYRNTVRDLVGVDFNLQKVFQVMTSGMALTTSVMCSHCHRC